MYALMGWPKKPSSAAEFTIELRKKQVASKAGDLYGMWQNRVAELGDAGWSVAANTSKGLRDRAGAQRCRPTFFIPKGATGFRANQARGRESFRTCNRTAVCPFCYARGVRDLWQRVDFALFHAPEALGRRETEAAILQQQMEDSDVSGQSQELLLGTDHESENTEAQVLTQNLGVDLLWWWDQRLVEPDDANNSELQRQLFDLVREEWPAMMNMKAPSPLRKITGGLQSLSVEPYTRDGKRKFLLTIRRLMIAPHRGVTANTNETVAKRVKTEVKLLRQPTRKLVVKEFAKLMRYPTELMRGDVPLTVAALHASKYENFTGRVSSLRLLSTTGSILAANKELQVRGAK